MAVGPEGQVLVEGDHREGMVYATIDAAEVASVREKFPFLEDARPDLYDSLFRVASDEKEEQEEEETPPRESPWDVDSRDYRF